MSTSEQKCKRCSGVLDHTTGLCCSSHNVPLCHECYKRTHFVCTPCHPNCPLCAASLAAVGADQEGHQ